MRSLLSFFFLVLLLVFAACSDPVSVNHDSDSKTVENDTTALVNPDGSGRF